MLERMNFKLKNSVIYTAVYFLILSGLYYLNGNYYYSAAEEIPHTAVNPHWTGKFCQECHTEQDPREKDAQLQFEGDSIKLCNRCHMTTFARADIHPVNVIPQDDLLALFPQDFPLENGKVSCLTCHDALIQMDDNATAQSINPKFVRGAPYERLMDFCFLCHQEDQYLKENPHQQLDEHGNIIENSCLFCHQSLPDPHLAESIGAVSFKSELAYNCTPCHTKHEFAHPEKADHLVLLSKEMKEYVTAQSSKHSIELPLDGEKIFCGTCHNPHQEGIIQRKEVQYGAGEKYFLRMSGGYDLCVMCHKDPRIKKQVAAAAFKGKIINPHWSGTLCNVCHLEDQPVKTKAELKYENDIIQLCNSCHESGEAGSEIHPVEVILKEEMRTNFPHDWPLQDGKLTCTTCHDVIMQMKADPAKQHTNSVFLRGAPYETLSTFCFVCHIESDYRQATPHKQIDAQGNIIENSCRFCHGSVPDAQSVKSKEDVTFKGELRLYCINCHAEKKSAHPARADHLVALNDTMLESLAAQSKELGVELPLDGSNIFCGTCHNPHEKGVIQRKAVRTGAGVESFVRLRKGYELCISCHGDKKHQETDQQTFFTRNLFAVQKSIQSSHKPMDEKKCKLCHVFDPQVRKKPSALAFCFKSGCHTTEIIEQRYAHEKSVLENCYLCHRSHSSAYRKLLISNEERLCRSCHPQLRSKTPIPFEKIAAPADEEDTGATAEEQEKEKKLKKALQQTDFEKDKQKPEEQVPQEPHTVFMQYLQSNKDLRGRECDFCHSPGHKQEIGTIDLATCADCHLLMQDVLYSASDEPLNIHQTFDQKACSYCHDPHSAQYEHLLRLNQPLENYRMSRPKKMGIRLPGEKNKK